MIETYRKYVSNVTSYLITAVAFAITLLLFYKYYGLGFTAQWGGTIAAIWSTVYLVYKDQMYWIWTIAYSILWGILFFQSGLNALGAYQFITIALCVSGMVQWFLVKKGIGINWARTSDKVVTFFTTVAVGAAIYAYWPSEAINGWYLLEISSVLFAVLAIWGDAFRYKGNWIAWILSNLAFWPLTVQGKLWGPFLATFVYTAIDIVGFYHWRKEEKEGVEDVKKKPREKTPIYIATKDNFKELKEA
jgi:hypothetical protein